MLQLKSSWNFKKKTEQDFPLDSLAMLLDHVKNIANKGKGGTGNCLYYQ